MTKAAIVDQGGRIRSSVIKHTGAEHRHLANQVVESVLRKAGLVFEDVSYVVATGYGRIAVPFADRQITELTCHTRGVCYSTPDIRLAIDIGGQDAKGLKIENGKLLDFVMSDKCAAGTGRFLEIMADTLGVDLGELGPLSLKSTHTVSISNTCSVFAKREVVSRLSQGVPVEDILSGVHHAIANRTAKMVARLNVNSDIIFTGGVAMNVGVVDALEKSLGCRVQVPEKPLLTGAIGAALMGKDIALKALNEDKAIQRSKHRLSEITFFS
jgi:predicted CoA-substrate-specific enzyme activase